MDFSCLGIRLKKMIDISNIQKFKKKCRFNFCPLIFKAVLNNFSFFEKI